MENLWKVDMNRLIKLVAERMYSDPKGLSVSNSSTRDRGERTCRTKTEKNIWSIKENIIKNQSERKEFEKLLHDGVNLKEEERK